MTRQIVQQVKGFANSKGIVLQRLYVLAELNERKVTNEV